MLIIQFVVSDKLVALQAAWFVGDEFCLRTFSSHYKLVATASDKNSHWYVHNKYDMVEFSSSKYSTSIRNVLARIKAQINKAIGDQIFLPAVIVVVLDDDVIKQSKISYADAKEGEYRLIVKYLMEETHRLVINHQKNLPDKCKVEHFPHFIWIIPPNHKYFNNNRLREFFASAIEAEVDKYHDMCALRLKKIWDEDEGSLYLREQRRYTEQGLNAYWSGVDKAIKFWDRTFKEIMLKKQKKKPTA